MSSDGEFLVFLDDPPAVAEGDSAKQGSDEFLYILDGPESAPGTTDDDQETNVALAEDISIENIAACYRQLAAVEIRSGGSIVVDMSAVKKVDTASMQLLGYFRRRCDEKSMKLKCNNVGKDITELAALLGYSGAL